MPILTLKTKNGTIHYGRYPIHAIMAEEMGINVDDIVDKGIKVKGGRVCWVGTNKV